MAQGDPPVYQLVDSNGNVQAEIRHDLAQSLIIDQLNGSDIDFQQSDLSNIASLSTDETTVNDRLTATQYPSIRRKDSEKVASDTFVDLFEISADFTGWLFITAQSNGDTAHLRTETISVINMRTERSTNVIDTVSQFNRISSITVDFTDSNGKTLQAKASDSNGSDVLIEASFVGGHIL